MTNYIDWIWAARYNQEKENQPAKQLIALAEVPHFDTGYFISYMAQIHAF